MFGRPPEEKAVAKGLDFLNKDNYEKAEQEFNRALEIKPKYSEAYYQLGILYKIQGKTDQAAESYKKALEVDPSNNRARYMLKLLTDTDTVLAPPPGTTAPPTQSTSTKAPKIDLDKIKADLKKEIKETFDRAINFANDENLEEAIKQLEKSIKLNPSNYKAYYNLAVAHLRTGHPGKATTHLRQAVKINPQYQIAKDVLGQITKKET